MEEVSPKPVCAQEALNLLNCVTESPFDQDKCLRLLHSLRECVLSKVTPLSLHSLSISLKVGFLSYIFLLQ